jgi:uncharacterized membrane protein
METAFKLKNYEGGVIEGIQAVAQHLRHHFPASGSRKNELPNHVAVL